MHRLFIIEGLPCSGKSTTSSYVASLLPYKIYDLLPWETEKPLMLDKWRQFVAGLA